MSEQEYQLRWNNFTQNVVSVFESLLGTEDFVDCTLACGGQSVKAHKVVLSACSPYFRDLLKTTPCQHPIIVLRDVSFMELKTLIHFMYHGEVNVRHDCLGSFLRTAEFLQVRGLAEQSSQTLEQASHLRNGEPKQKRQKRQATPPRPTTPTPPPVSVPAHVEPDNVYEQSSLNAVDSEDQMEDSTSNNTADTEVYTDSRNVVSESTRNILSGRDVSLIVTDSDNRSQVKTEHQRVQVKTEQEDYDDMSQPDVTIEEDDSLPAHSVMPSNQSHLEMPQMGVPLSEQMLYHDSGQALSDLAKSTQALLGGEMMPGPSQMSPSNKDTLQGKFSNVCNYCGKTLSSSGNLKRHVEDVHTVRLIKHKCMLCNKLYSTRNSLYTHMSTQHRRPREPVGPKFDGDTTQYT